MLFNTLPNLIIVHRIVSEKMHTKHEKMYAKENTERRKVQGAWNIDE